MRAMGDDVSAPELDHHCDTARHIIGTCIAILVSVGFTRSPRTYRTWCTSIFSSIFAMLSIHGHGSWPHEHESSRSGSVDQWHAPRENTGDNYARNVCLTGFTWHSAC